MPFEFYIIVIITLVILGGLCLFKNIKEGFMAACFGGVVTAIIFAIHYVYSLTSNFFDKTGLTFKDILSYILCIALTCLGFIGIIFTMKFLGIKKR